MNFITITLRYLVVINCLMSIEYAAHHFTFGGSITGLNRASRQVILSSTPRFAQATHPTALRILARNPWIFQRFCNHVFLQSVPLGLPGSQWSPYVNDVQNSFLEFVQNPSYPFSTEVQFTPKNVWPNSLLVDFPPSSETENHTVIFNLIINKEDDRDRIILLNPQTKPDTPLIIGVFQLGLGADRLQNSKDPETKAWIEFLTQAHLKKDIPAYTPDSVAAAYGTLDLHHWPEALKTQYYDSLLPQKPLTQKELDDVIAIICFCLDRSYPLATMVKYTGLCPEVIKNILAKIKQMPGL